MSRFPLAVAILAFSAASASAADMAVKAAPVAPPVPVYTWTGWYVGLNGGWVDKTGGTNTDAVILSTSTFPINATNIANSATNRFGGNANGFIGGAQFGYSCHPVSLLALRPIFRARVCEMITPQSIHSAVRQLDSCGHSG
jgi:outer membrane immunogenic protein